MLKRNATGVVTDAELRRRRWQMIRRLIGAAAVVLAAVIVWALFVPGTDWLTALSRTPLFTKPVTPWPASGAANW